MAEEQLELATDEAEEIAAIENILEQHGVPKERSQRGRGMFGSSSAGRAPALVEDDLEDTDDDSEELDEPLAAEPAPEPAAPAKAKAEEKPAAPNLLSQLAQEILGDASIPAPDPAAEGFSAREERRMREVLEDNQKLRESMNVMLQHMRQSVTTPAGQPETTEEDDDETSFFENPKANVEKLMQPLLEEIQRLKANDEMTRIDMAERDYARQHDDYLPALRAWREGSHARMMKLGATQEQADAMLQEQDRGMFALAERLGKPPWVVAHKIANDFLELLAGQKAAQAPAAPAAAPAPSPAPAARRDGSIAAARAASSSAAAGSISSGSSAEDGGEVTVDSLLESGASPEEIRNILRTGGTPALMKLIAEAETRAVRERRR